jgi:hypothetical protein
VRRAVGAAHTQLGISFVDLAALGGAGGLINNTYMHTYIHTYKLGIVMMVVVAVMLWRWW